MNMKKRFILFLMLVLLIIPVVSRDVYADSDDFKVEVSASKNADGETFSVSMNITNLGSDFKGIARLIVSTNDSSTKAGFDADISIPAGSTKEYIVKVPIDHILERENIDVKILDLKEKEVFSISQKSIFSTYSSTINQGILSDHPEKLTILDMGGESQEINGEKFTIKQIELDGSSVQEKLNSIDMLVIDDFDTSTLSNECIEAILNWIDNGGMLVIGGGKGAERTISGFDNGAMFDVELQTISNDSYTIYNLGEAVDVDFAYFVYGTNYNYASNDYMRVQNKGRGSVSVLSISFADFEKETTYRNDALKGVYSDAYGNTSKFMSDQNGNLTNYDLEETMGYMEKPAQTGKVILSFIIIIYTILIGPGIYLILKSAKKRETIWIFIPVISLVFVGLVFLVSLSIRINHQVVKSINIVNTGSKKQDTYVFGYAPGTSKWSMEVNGDYTYGISMGSYDMNNGITGSVNQKSDKMELNCYPSGTFENKAFCLSKSFSNDDKIVVEALVNYDGIVTNRTSAKFDYMVVYDNSGYQLFTDVSPGDVINFSLDPSNSTYQDKSRFRRNEATTAYEKADYEKAADCAAIASIMERDGENELTVIGITKGESVTGDKEESWTCYTNR